MISASRSAGCSSAREKVRLRRRARRRRLRGDPDPDAARLPRRAASTARSATTSGCATTSRSSRPRLPSSSQPAPFSSRRLYQALGVPGVRGGDARLHRARRSWKNPVTRHDARHLRARRRPGATTCSTLPGVREPARPHPPPGRVLFDALSRPEYGPVAERAARRRARGDRGERPPASRSAASSRSAPRSASTAACSRATSTSCASSRTARARPDRRSAWSGSSRAPTPTRVRDAIRALLPERRAGAHAPDFDRRARRLLGADDADRLRVHASA